MAQVSYGGLNPFDEEVADDTWHYMWDARNKLTKVRKDTGAGFSDVATYTYDAQGRRHQKGASGATTTYYQDGLTPVVETATGLTKRHRAVAGTLGNVIETDDGTDTVFYAYDRLGNVIATFGTDGATVYDGRAGTADGWMSAFGHFPYEITTYAPDRPENFAITTKQYDEDIELLYYFNAR